MTGTNHALTGALILSVVNPVIGLPLAFVSHFVLDSLPHYGEEFGYRKKLTKSVWATDFALLVVGLNIALVTNNYLAMLGALAAMSPDFAWIFRFVFIEKWGRIKPAKMNRFNSWHAKIQKYERKWGIIIEVPYLVVMILLNVKFVL